MTTDQELLARIEVLTPEQMLKALRAVVELHKPVAIVTPCPDGKSGCAVMHYSNDKACSCGFFNYPCPTIQAIEKELG